MQSTLTPYGVIPLRWSTERFMALVESGVVPESSGIELSNGQVVTEMPQGGLHRFAYMALQRILISFGASTKGLEVNTTLKLPGDNVFDPDLAFLRPEAIDTVQVPSGDDVLWVIEVSVSSRLYDLGDKARAYAAAGIPDYWVIDVPKRGVWSFSDPLGDVYGVQRFFPETERPVMPVLGVALDIAAIMPRVEAEP